MEVSRTFFYTYMNESFLGVLKMFLKLLTVEVIIRRYVYGILSLKIIHPRRTASVRLRRAEERGSERQRLRETRTVSKGSIARQHRPYHHHQQQQQQQQQQQHRVRQRHNYVVIVSAKFAELESESEVCHREIDARVCNRCHAPVLNKSIRKRRGRATGNPCVEICGRIQQ